MSWAYYNEFDKKAAAWLRELIHENLIAPGEVDERSIEDVLPSELAGFTQCHFFAGIGGWSYALRLASWPDDRPVWTGSCPCQPFSPAGKGEGFADERHLWPAWHHFIGQRKPPVIFGEQVESAIRHGWLDLVQDDLEGLGYAFGASGLPAACVGAPHIRQRLWFVADTEGERLGEAGGRGERSAQWAGVESNLVELGNTSSEGLAQQFSERGAPLETIGRNKRETTFGTSASIGRMADAERFTGNERCEPAMRRGRANSAQQIGLGRGPWDSALWTPCRDGKYRPVESALVGLADGISDSLGLVRDADTGETFFHPLIEKGKTTQRAMRLKGYGNAIVPQVAAEFIRAYLEAGK